MVNRWLYAHVPYLRQALTLLTYQYVSLVDRSSTVLFLNYGFADLDPMAAALGLSKEDEKDRYEIQLYHHIASAIKWSGLDALEVSSGRGGGASYITRRFRPGSYVGVDLASRAVDFCNRHYNVDGLSFVTGNAERLHFPDASFDVVINVEASFYYPNLDRFLGEVVRVLRPNGHFLYADMRYGEELETWQEKLHRTGLELLGAEDITRNVLRGLQLCRARREKLIERYVPRILRAAFAEFAGITGAGMEAGPPQVGKRTYWSYVFRKSDTRLESAAQSIAAV